ncbi:FKBP-type peptidyl-prolyl cis-trans isomerase [uncultured Acetobacteroides sp.]|uniref:FKBP-type peptidyl-prolyl cis-trans isomerase n=1 Tax=uncultured Acetobacteroides sp. TaxID=1760811 RepID=UPI0029F5B644|nr:FKBP-type peptidyl-prolyl cis-trans isomerase [uncultured Acetobacteroides sp.]
MRFFKHTFFVVTLACAAAFITSCGKEETTTTSLVAQNTLIESFVKTTKLTDSVEKSGDLWCNRFVKGANSTKIQVGDEVTFYYILSVVKDATTLEPYATNIESVAKAKALANPFSKYEPITVVVGKSGLPKGFDLGLRLLYDGDAAQILFPSTYGYGASDIGAVPANSAIGVRVYISKVER